MENGETLKQRSRCPWQPGQLKDGALFLWQSWYLLSNVSHATFTGHVIAVRSNLLSNHTQWPLHQLLQIWRPNVFIRIVKCITTYIHCFPFPNFSCFCSAADKDIATAAATAGESRTKQVTDWDPHLNPLQQAPALSQCAHGHCSALRRSPVSPTLPGNPNKWYSHCCSVLNQSWQCPNHARCPYALL